MLQLQTIKTETVTGETLASASDVNQQDILINLTFPMHKKCLGNLIIKIVHYHFHHFHRDNLADRNSPGTSKFPEETINTTHMPNQDATCQGVSMEQTLEVEKAPIMGTHDHTTIPTLTPHHKEFILQMLLVLYTLTQSHYKITHTATKILTHLNYSFQSHAKITMKRIIMLAHTKMKIT